MGGISISWIIWRKFTQKFVYSSGDRDFSSEQVSKWLTFSIFFTLLSILVWICNIFKDCILVYFWHYIWRKLLFFNFFPFCAYNGAKSSIIVVIRFSLIFIQFTREYQPFLYNFDFFFNFWTFWNFFQQFFFKITRKYLNKNCQVNPGKD